MDDGSPLIECVSLVRFYDTESGRIQAVRGVDLEIDQSATVAIVGPSGCGKSSLLRMVAGIDPPTAGFVRIEGVDLYQLREGRRARVRGRLLTNVHQRPSDNLFAHLTARQHLERLENASGSGRSISSTDALEHLGLMGVSGSVPKQMSGGEQQRLAFAAALVAGHRLVIADEPTSQLDGASAKAVLDAMNILTESGVTILVATHDDRVLERVHQVLTLRDGAVASVLSHDSEWAVIDRAGRIQLPPSIRERFANRRAEVVWNEDAETAEIRPV